MTRILYIFLISSLALISCKNQKKIAKVIQNEPVFSNQVVKELRPLVSSISAQYIFEDSTKINVFSKIEIINTNESTTIKSLGSQFTIAWSIVSDYGPKERLKTGRLEFSDQNVSEKDGLYYLKFEIPKLKNVESAVLILDLIDNGASKKYTTDVPLDFLAKRVNYRYGLYRVNENHPNFDNYLNLGQEITIKSILPNDKELYLVKYKPQFLPALSPMSATKRNVKDEVVFEKVLKINSGKSFKVLEEGLFVLTEDTLNHDDGFSFMVTDERFPKLTFADELREPIVYLSTQKEIEELKSEINPKNALDLYFLSLSSGNQFVAKNTIKAYFNRVEVANKLFSNYKEGWKTDKGMVYIVLGPPSRVQRNRQREVWLYSQNQNFPEIIFTFYRKSNSFGDNNYELVRYPEYGTYWYPFIEVWRTGTVAE
jgi:GWxTD domain-containing protein